MAAVAAVQNKFDELNTQVLGISTDSVYSHKVFLETSPSLKAVRYPLVSDRNQEISRAYKLMNDRTGASLRASVIIDPSQTIAAKLIYPAEVGRNIDEHVRLLEALQFAQKTGKGVPANWTSGKNGVTRSMANIGKI